MDDLDLLKRFRAPVRDPAPEEVDAAWRSLLPRLRSDPPDVRKRRARRERTVGLGVAAAALALALALPILIPDGRPGGADPAAAAALRRAAAAAERHPDTWPGPGEYLYTRSRTVETYYYVVGNGMPNFSYVASFVREEWISLDGSGRERYSYDEVRFPSAQDRVAWLAAGSPELSEDRLQTDREYGPGGMHVFDLSGLPTDADELLEVIEDREVIGGPPGDWETFTLIGDLLREPAPPGVRSALFEAAAQVQGVEYHGTTTVAGRSGVVIGYTHAGLREERIFDPDTGEMLGERYVVMVPEEIVEITRETWPGTIYGLYSDRPGTVVRSKTYLESGIIDSTDARP